MPGLAEKPGVKLLATYVPMANRLVYAAVEADDANAVREFAFQRRLSQWFRAVIRMAVLQMKICGGRDPRHPDLAVKAA